jgi:hypothetical protein
VAGLPVPRRKPPADAAFSSKRGFVLRATKRFLRRRARERAFNGRPNEAPNSVGLHRCRGIALNRYRGREGVSTGVSRFFVRKKRGKIGAGPSKRPKMLKPNRS